jgi:hypothetical protein
MVQKSAKNDAEWSKKRAEVTLKMRMGTWILTAGILLCGLGLGLGQAVAGQGQTTATQGQTATAPTQPTAGRTVLAKPGQATQGPRPTTSGPGQATSGQGAAGAGQSGSAAQPYSGVEGPPQPPLPPPTGTVIFSRSSRDANSSGDNSNSTNSGEANSGDAKSGDVNSKSNDTNSGGVNATLANSTNSTETKLLGTDAEREAILITKYDLDVRLAPAQNAVDVRAQLQVKNSGAEALSELPLQVSSSLNWVSVRLKNTPLKFIQQTFGSDLDHTGEVHEVVIELPQALAPGAELTLDVIYGGAVAEDATRLTRIGAPVEAAASADWDQVSTEFIGMRGFGNVVWYPVASPAEALGDGARVFEAIGRMTEREQDATVGMRVQVEYVGAKPNLVVLDGVIVSGDSQQQSASEPDQNASQAEQGYSSSKMPSSESTSTSQNRDAVHPAPDKDQTAPQIANYVLAPQRLGFQTPSLFVLARELNSSDGLNIYALTEHDGYAQGYTAAAALVQPMFKEWFGAVAATGANAEKSSAAQLPEVQQSTPQQPIPLTLVDLMDRSDEDNSQTMVNDLPETQPYESGAVSFLALRDAAPARLAGELVHPLAHAWFQSQRVWMSEGFAEFAELLWMEREAGREIAYQRMEQQRPALALVEPDLSVAGVSSGLSENSDENSGESLIDARDDVYYRTKAAYVWGMLRDMVGQKALAAAMLQYEAAQDSNPNTFEKLLEATSDKDLEWFFDDWVYRDMGLPDLRIDTITPKLEQAATSTGPGTYVVAVDVSNDGAAAAEVPVTVRAGTVTTTARLRINGHSHATVREVIAGYPNDVTVNDGSVPEERDSVHNMTVQ